MRKENGQPKRADMERNGEEGASEVAIGRQMPALILPLSNSCGYTYQPFVPLQRCVASNNDRDKNRFTVCKGHTITTTVALQVAAER